MQLMHPIICHSMHTVLLYSILLCSSDFQTKVLEYAEISQEPCRRSIKPQAKASQHGDRRPLFDLTASRTVLLIRDA